MREPPIIGFRSQNVSRDHGTGHRIGTPGDGRIGARLSCFGTLPGGGSNSTSSAGISAGNCSAGPPDPGAASPGSGAALLAEPFAGGGNNSAPSPASFVLL